MSAPVYSSVTGAAVALVAATAKSILGVKANAASGVLLKEATVSFDGVTAGAVPVLVELCYATFATNGPGTSSTSVTPVQLGGRVLAHGVTAARAWTAEPTVLTVLTEKLIHPQAGVIEQIPLGDEPDTAFAEGFVIRCTAPAVVNVRGTLKFGRA